MAPNNCPNWTSLLKFMTSNIEQNRQPNEPGEIMRQLKMRTRPQPRKAAWCMLALLTMAALAFTAAAGSAAAERPGGPDQPAAPAGSFERAGPVQEGDDYSFMAFSRDSSAFLAKKYSPGKPRWDRVRLWDARSLKPLTEPLVQDTEIWYCGVTAHGKMVFTADRKAIRLWDVATSKLRSTIKVMDEKLLYRVDFSADGTRFTTIVKDEHAVAVWRTGDARPTLLLPHERGPSSAVFDPTGTRIITDDGLFHVFATDSGREICPPIGSDNEYFSEVKVRFDSSGHRLLVPQGHGFTLIDLPTGKTLTDVKIADPKVDKVYDVQFSVDDTKISVTTVGGMLVDGPARIYDAATGKFEREIGSAVVECKIGPGGRWILCRPPGERPLELWDLAGGVKVQTFPKGNAHHLSPDGSFILFESGGIPGSLLEVWRLKPGLPTTP